MRTVRLFLGCITPAFAALGVGVAQTPVQVGFFGVSPADQHDAKAYRAIWDEYGERIVAALEARTCLPFQEPIVLAEVAEAVSNSGGPEHPMRLRASYSRQVKEATLVHELGHRHLWQLTERLDDVDGHMTLYLVLDGVWTDVWGKKFAEERVRGEAGWDDDYASAWAWARSMKPEERARLWNELLEMNGFPGDCSLADSAGRG